MEAIFKYPTRIRFGEGARRALPAELKELGLTHLLLVTDRGLWDKTPIPKEIAGIVEAGGVRVSTFTDVDPNPTEAQVLAGAERYRAQQCDGLLGVGGGSPLDAARGIAIAVNHRRPLADYDDLKGGDALITGHVPPLVAIPTTAGTGSEVSRSAVITVPSVDRKVVLFSPRCLPRLAICDPELTYDLPRRITAETGMDALSHNLEALMASGYHPIADGIALRAIAMIMAALPRLMRDGRDVEARRDMLAASTMGAMAFQKGLGVVHSLAHPLSTVSGLSHGLANAILLPHAVRFNAQAAAPRLALLAHHLRLPGADPAAEVAEAVADLNRQAGLPQRLSEAGVKLTDLPKLVAKAQEDGCHQSNPRPCAAADFEELYKRAF